MIDRLKSSRAGDGASVADPPNEIGQNRSHSIRHHRKPDYPAFALIGNTVSDTISLPIFRFRLKIIEFTPRNMSESRFREVLQIPRGARGRKECELAMISEIKKSDRNWKRVGIGNQNATENCNRIENVIKIENLVEIGSEMVFPILGNARLIGFL